MDGNVRLLWLLRGRKRVREKQKRKTGKILFEQRRVEKSDFILFTEKEIDRVRKRIHLASH